MKDALSWSANFALLFRRHLDFSKFFRCSSWDLHGADFELRVGWSTSLCRYITEWKGGGGGEGEEGSSASCCGKYLERRERSGNTTDNEAMTKIGRAGDRFGDYMCMNCANSPGISGRDKEIRIEE